MNRILVILSMVFAVVVSSCKEGKTDEAVPEIQVADSCTSELTETGDSLLLLTQAQADSLEFRLLHHYTNNFNFVVTADTLVLVPKGDEVSDTCSLLKGDIIAVASIVEADTVWVKVARDQWTMGWISEDELLKGTVPDDMISQFIDALTGSRAVWMSLLVLLGVVGFLLRRRLNHRLQIFQPGEMDSFYPILFVMLVGVMAALYASIQNFAPEYWQEYYYHPTLNPLLLPPIMAILLVVAWLVVVAYIAVIAEVYNHFYFLPGMNYLLETTGLAMVVYLVISWTTRFYVGYLLLLALIVGLLIIYFRYVRCQYECGSCGAKVKEKGVCPYCGAVNE